ncbi:hypothetical protein KY358_01450 [Candidatus Woesearchaeota archaeon]|nr:hypothetical protein [Candidatus Woesearchaeota archaeon]
MKDEKAQIQMGESVAILFIFIVFVMFGFVFYMNVISGSSKTEMEENIQLEAIQAAQKASFLPELQCSRENIITEGCIDIMKLEAASGTVRENNIYYYDVFESSRIWVEEIFPEKKMWILYNGTMANYSNRLSTFIPVSLFNGTSEDIGFGILAIEFYKK